MNTLSFINSLLQKPTPVVELKRTHSTLPGIVKNFDTLSNNNHKKSVDIEDDTLIKNEIYQRKNSEFKNENNKTDETNDNDFSSLLESQFKKSFSISTPHKNNKYRDKKENSSKTINRNFNFSSENTKLNRDFEDLDGYDSDPILDESINIKNSSVCNKKKEIDNRMNKSNPPKFKSSFNMKTDINNNTLLTNKSLLSLPNYTNLSTKSKTGFFSQYNNFNRDFLYNDNIFYLKYDNKDQMDTDISNIFNYIYIIFI